MLKESYPYYLASEPEYANTDLEVTNKFMYYNNKNPSPPLPSASFSSFLLSNSYTSIK